MIRGIQLTGILELDLSLYEKPVLRIFKNFDCGSIVKDQCNYIVNNHLR